MIKRSLFMVLFGFGACVGARAADVPAAPLYKAPQPAAPSWSGFYVGLGVGSRYSQADATMTSAAYVSANATQDLLGANCLGCFTGERLNGGTFRINPYVGLNWQIARQWVVGIEGDWGWGDQTTAIKGMFFPASFATFGVGTDSFAVRTTWDASARARLGLLVNPALLVYATGGAAWQHVEGISTCTAGFPVGVCNNLFAPALNPFGPSVVASGLTRSGWTVGGGIEAMLWSNWFVRADYRFADFGTANVQANRTCPSPCVLGGITTNLNASYDLRLQTHTIAFGLAYKFD